MSIKKIAIAGWIASLLTVAACYLNGGISLNDPEVFRSKPYVREHLGKYSLCWQYGRMGFYFQPSSRIEDGHIVFALSATSSSGSQTGKYGELLLGGDRQLNAVRNGGAFWLEPSGEKVPLDVLAVDACGPNKPLHATAVKNEAR